ncbi:MAG: hypothetical protein BWK77_07515 [Verrucomicrobia bacterium A1]|nr:MAG: hypothetical protein BWK77_07515 [Verrucomicrobia bacterium A1]
MKTKWMILTAAAAVAGTAWAVEPAAGAGGQGPEGGGPGLREHLRKLFDADGDGKLTGAELEKAKAAAEKFDKNDDGELGRRERKAAHEALRERRNGDGEGEGPRRRPGRDGPPPPPPGRPRGAI